MTTFKTLIITLVFVLLVIGSQAQSVKEECCMRFPDMGDGYQTCVDNHGGDPDMEYETAVEMMKMRKMEARQSTPPGTPEIFPEVGTTENVCNNVWGGLCHTNADWQAGWYVANIGWEQTVKLFNNHFEIGPALVSKPHHYPYTS